MTRCLDEATLQGYFDGELSSQMMESATLHLAGCAACAAAARELEAETNILTAALAAEFEAPVPTERLRQRIDTAVWNARPRAVSSKEKFGFGDFVSGVLSFATQRNLGYASLVMVMAFVAVLGLIRMGNRIEPVVTTPPQVKNSSVAVTPPAVPATAAAVPAVNDPKPGAVPFRPVKTSYNATSRQAPASAPVKLLPGERTYLQTIARLDSTIKSNKRQMRPSLQVEYERNLAVVDRAIAATRSAAKSNPNDPDAADFMFAAYQSKVDLLNTIADARVSGGRPR